jgi:hypothetical protein
MDAPAEILKSILNASSFRPFTRKATMRPDELSYSQWTLFARERAREACEETFATRWGVYPAWPGKDLEVLCYFNNHPYRKFPALRDEEMKKLKERLEKAGIKQLAYVTYPTDGPADGYSCAMVLDARADQETFVLQVYEKIADESWEWIKRQPVTLDELPDDD